MLRESMGVVTEGANGVFMRKMAKVYQPRKPIPSDTQHIFVAIDPNGGGPSHFAICSVIGHHGSLLVSGLHTCSVCLIYFGIQCSAKIWPAVVYVNMKISCARLGVGVHACIKLSGWIILDKFRSSLL